MSAEELRRAASLMRERAEESVCSCGGPACTVEHGGVRRDEMEARFEDWSRVVDHYLPWSPALALAVADWLDAVADAWPVSNPNYWSSVRAEAIGHRQALIVARAYLGSDT